MSAADREAVLLPCPFCGGHAEIIEADEAGDSAYAVQCQTRSCQASSLVAFALKEPVEDLLIEKWNRRALSPEGREGWKDIETAPTKGGPSYLVWCPDRMNIYVVVHRDYQDWGEPGWFHFGGGSMSRLTEQPTHWRTLPASPGHEGGR